MNTTDLIHAIKAGQYDEDIHLLRGEILNRHLILQAHQPAPNTQINFPTRVTQNINDFRIGKKVMINQRAATGYLRGQRAVVIRVKRTRVTIKLDQGPQGRFADGTVTCPVDLLTIIG